MELTRLCPIQRPVYGIAFTAPVQQGSLAIAAPGMQAQMGLQVQQFNDSSHQLRESSMKTTGGQQIMYCIFCAAVATWYDWIKVLASVEPTNVRA